MSPRSQLRGGLSEQASWAFRGLAGGFGRDGVGRWPVAGGGLADVAVAPARRA
jgi:hypothetical protein